MSCHVICFLCEVSSVFYLQGSMTVRMLPYKAAAYVDSTQVTVFWNRHTKLKVQRLTREYLTLWCTYTITLYVCEDVDGTGTDVLCSGPHTHTVFIQLYWHCCRSQRSCMETRSFWRHRSRRRCFSHGPLVWSMSTTELILCQRTPASEQLCLQRSFKLKRCKCSQRGRLAP